ncbi:hypothetical protein [Chryseobacterium fistulae]|nr:hypothetical protein [Chryseobacterium fistulae]
MSSEYEDILKPTQTIKKEGYFKYKKNKIIVTEPYNPTFQILKEKNKLIPIKEYGGKYPYYDGKDFQKGSIYKIKDLNHLELIDKGNLTKYFYNILNMKYLSHLLQPNKQMRKILFFLSLFFLLNCKNESGLQDNLYKIVLDYQKKNTFKETPKNSMYVYEVYFYQDSTVSVSLSPIGVNLEEKNLYGIYKDRTLKATYIIDDNRIGKNLVKKYIQRDLDKFVAKDFVINDAMYPEYIYKIKGKELVLIDSIRGNVKR